MRRWTISGSSNPNIVKNTTSSFGIVLFMVGLILMTAMDAAVKWLVEDKVHVIQLLFVRSIIITTLLLGYYASRKQLSQLKPVRLKAQCLRGLIGFAAPFGFFLALKFLPLTAANVVFFSNIFLITLGSAVFLKERVGIYRWSAVFVGYIGVVIAIDPGADGELFGYMMILLSSATFAFLFISGKILGSTETSQSLVLFYNMGVGFIALFWLPGVWQSLPAADWLGILLVSVLAVFGQYCMTQAFALAEASLLAPLNYTTLVLTVLFDLVLWQTIASAQTLLGATIIIMSSCVVIYRQHQLDTRRATSPGNP